MSKNKSTLRLRAATKAVTNGKSKVINNYVIGDLQGCFDAYIRLLEHISFNSQTDKLWFAGDLVARGEDSLSTLRHVKNLCEQGCAETVLGNHDITLIASWRGLVKSKPKDNVANIFAADDCDSLLNWLRQQPLMLEPSSDSVLVHAGVPPNWTIAEALGYAKEVETILKSNLKTLDKVLLKLYKREADIWSNELDASSRLRAITNYFTRMRICDKNGNLEFTFKSGINDDMPDGFKPWFCWQPQVLRQHKVIFGHWAALKAAVDTDIARAIDAGCVWGGEMMAYRLEDKKVFRVSANKTKVC